MNGRHSLVAGGRIFCETKEKVGDSWRAGDQVEIVSRWRQGGVIVVVAIVAIITIVAIVACNKRQQATEESETVRN